MPYVFFMVRLCLFPPHARAYWVFPEEVWRSDGWRYGEQPQHPGSRSTWGAFRVQRQCSLLWVCQGIAAFPLWKSAGCRDYLCSTAKKASAAKFGAAFANAPSLLATSSHPSSEWLEKCETASLTWVIPKCALARQTGLHEKVIQSLPLHHGRG